MEMAGNHRCSCRGQPLDRLVAFREIAVRNLVGATDAVAREFRAAGSSQLDRGSVLSP